MNLFQTMTSGEIEDARCASAQMLGDLLLREAAKLLLEYGGYDAVKAFLTRAGEAIERVPIDHPRAEALREIAVEQAHRSADFAASGSSSLNGWTLDGGRAAEETKPEVQIRDT